MYIYIYMCISICLIMKVNRYTCVFMKVCLLVAVRSIDSVEVFSRPEQLEYGFGVIYAGFPSFACFGIRGRSYSNFLASTVEQKPHRGIPERPASSKRTSTCGCARACGCAGGLYKHIQRYVHMHIYTCIHGYIYTCVHIYIET